MAERQDSDREVLTSLPRTRPVRRSAKRGARANAGTGAVSAPSRRAAPAKPGRAKAGATAGAKASAKKKAAPKPTAKTAPKATAQTAPRATAKRAPNAATKATPPRRKVPPAGYAAPASRNDDAGGGSGTADMINTTIQAAAELAQIGLTVGRQTLRSMFDRLPKP